MANTISVYLDDGRVFNYDVCDGNKAREHVSAIINTGYRSCSIDGVLEHFPPYRIVKVKATGCVANYHENVTGT